VSTGHLGQALLTLSNHTERNHEMSPHIYRMLVAERLAELRRVTRRHHYA
jgi:hypothetical protein